jgi:hypothetical protein
MLGKSFRIRGSNFRMLPNPTTDFWAKMTFQKPAWKVTKLMEVFQEKLTELIKSEGLHGDHEIVKISRTWEDISGLKMGADDDKIPLDVCELIHDALDDRTAYQL